MQQTDLEHVLNSHQHFREIERFAHKILRPCLQSPHLVRRLCGSYQHREILIRIARVKSFQRIHYLKTVHNRHLQIQQD